MVSQPECWRYSVLDELVKFQLVTVVIMSSFHVAEKIIKAARIGMKIKRPTFKNSLDHFELLSFGTVLSCLSWNSTVCEAVKGLGPPGG